MTSLVDRERVILHVDMDAFYASVEVVDDPRLKGLPVIVGGTPEGRGVVSTASYEAREYGVKSAMSAWQARKLCPQGIFLRPRMARYQEASARVFEIFASFTPLVEGLSIDEAFLDITGTERLFGPPREVARAIKARIRDELSLSASVGIAPNKYLAKIASELEKPDGLVEIRAGEAAARLAPMPVERLIGIGRVAGERLRAAGLRTVGEVATASAALLEAVAGAGAAGLRALALGLDARPVVTGGAPKSIGSETTFARDLADPAGLRAELDGLVDEVGRRLRAEGYRGRTLTLKARYPDFTTVTRSSSRPRATAATAVLRGLARDLFEARLGRGGRALRLLGVTVSNLEPAAAQAPTLFGPLPEARAEALDVVADRLRERFGVRAARRASGLEGEGDDEADPDPRGYDRKR